MIIRGVAALLLALAVVPAAAGCTASSDPRRPGPSHTTTRTLRPGVTVQAPAAWVETPYLGELGASVFPLAYLSTETLSGPCASGPKAECDDTGPFPKTWTTPTGGVLLLWTEIEPDVGISHITGTSTTIGGYPAKVRTGAATSWCAVEASTETDAYIDTGTLGDQTGGRYDMTACFGAKASAKDHADVEAMLESLHVAN